MAAEIPTTQELARYLGLIQPCPFGKFHGDLWLRPEECVACQGSKERMPTLEEVLDALEEEGIVATVFDRNDDRYMCSEPDTDSWGWCMGEPCGEGPTRLTAALALLKEVRHGR